MFRQSAHAAVSSSMSARVRHGARRLIISVLYSPVVDSIRALSRASPTMPVEAAMHSPVRCAAAGSSCTGRSRVRVAHQPGAVVAGPVSLPQPHLQGAQHERGGPTGATDQSTILREKVSMTNAYTVSVEVAT